jgi:hypothetical protein
LAGLDKNLKNLQQHLDNDEVIESNIWGTFEKRLIGKNISYNGVLAATNKKIVFFKKKLLGFNMEVFPYPNISSIEMNIGSLEHKVSISARGVMVKMKTNSKRDTVRFVELVKGRLGRKEEDIVSQDNLGNIHNEIEKLIDLKNNGIISDEEFEEKKNELMNLL